MADFRPLVTVNGHDIPTPSVYTATTATVVDSARNVLGYVIGAVIRDDIAKIEMSWRFITVQEWADILALFSPARGGNFYNTVTFFCHDTGQWETRTMYVSDRSASAFQRDANGNIRGYTDATMSLVEV